MCRVGRFLEEDSLVATVVITGELLGVVWKQCSLYTASNLSGLFHLILRLILCVLCLVYEGTCLLQGKDLVLHFEKQLKVREEAQ